MSENLKIDYKFKDKTLLHNALHHSSLKKKGKAFERLEFLGDRVLGLIIADYLFHLSETDNEGRLAQKFAALVNAKSCHQIALKLGINKVIQTANNKLLSENETVLADAMEALIGAIFIDGGFKAAQKMIFESWADLLAHINVCDPKTTLQEKIQKEESEAPQYVLVSKTGSDHNPWFCVEVRTKQLRAKGEGSSKKEAEIAAAAAALSLKQSQQKL